ncbi:MAG: helix-turn-helix transcriptional regulator, partial [Calditrichaeota bacterium]|nr:helix-turn-helix transcriptional regulator [Calditrichota bacterium]
MSDLDKMNLREWRTQKGLSQQRFMELSGLSLPTLREMEQGGARKPHKRTLQKLQEFVQNVESGAIDLSMPAGAPKKRGRKPKAALAAAPTEAAPAPKKRGRKPKAALAAEPTEAAPAP